MITLTAEAFEPGQILTAFCVGRDETGAVASFTCLLYTSDAADE